MKARTIFKCVAIAGVPVTGYLAAKGTLKCQELKRKEGEPVTLKEKALDISRGYGPSIIAGAVTIGSILLSDGLATKEIAAATALATAAITKKNVIKDQFDRYRAAVKDGEGGEEKDLEYVSKAAEVKFDGNGEVVRHFKLDWIDGETIEFDSTLAKVIDALNRVNRNLFDYNTGTGAVTVSDFLNYIDKGDLITDKTNKAGWCSELLAVTYDCYWVDFWVHPETEGLQDHGDGNPNTYVVDLCWPPEENLSKAIGMAEKEGLI